MSAPLTVTVASWTWTSMDGGESWETLLCGKAHWVVGFEAEWLLRIAELEAELAAFHALAKRAHTWCATPDESERRASAMAGLIVRDLATLHGEGQP